ncbi:MAG: type II toxin-antitoxin system RelE/ParE family toxin [Acidobacteria bacterium]|nr:type II toxin-antitoxin system RelE/ParE family toxin [Acidobacteriota bacterium]
MKLRFTEKAVASIRRSKAHYRREASASIAERFNADVIATASLLLRSPQLGRVPVFDDPKLANLRTLPLAGFPYAIYYRVEADAILIVDVIHGARDLKSLLR